MDKNSILGFKTSSRSAIFARRCFVVTMLVLSTFVGCNRGPRLVPVAGQVLIDGKPLSEGYIWVIPDGERAAGSPIDKQGRFQLGTNEKDDGVVLGKHRVTITAAQSLSPTRSIHLVPPKYFDVATSDLTVEITGPKKDWLIELSWNGVTPTIQDSSADGDVAPVTE